MMTYEDLMTLINHIDESNVAYMDYENGKEHVVLAKEVPKAQIKQEPESSIELPKTEEQAQTVAAPNENMTVDVSEKSENAEETVAKKGEAVKAPMVGVAYLQPDPEAEQYIEVGDRVKQGDVICIIEAMKLMNEIQAPRDGVVTEILVDNEEVVEYNQPLIRID